MNKIAHIHLATYLVKRAEEQPASVWEWLVNKSTALQEPKHVAARAAQYMAQQSGRDARIDAQIDGDKPKVMLAGGGVYGGLGAGAGAGIGALVQYLRGRDKQDKDKPSIGTGAAWGAGAGGLLGAGAGAWYGHQQAEQMRHELKNLPTTLINSIQ